MYSTRDSSVLLKKVKNKREAAYVSSVAYILIFITTWQEENPNFVLLKMPITFKERTFIFTKESNAIRLSNKQLTYLTPRLQLYANHFKM